MDDGRYEINAIVKCLGFFDMHTYADTYPLISCSHQPKNGDLLRNNLVKILFVLLDQENLFKKKCSQNRSLVCFYGFSSYKVALSSTAPAVKLVGTLVEKIALADYQIIKYK